jgi:predicted ATPase
LLPALARLISQAATHSQVLVVSHAARLIASLEREEASQSIVLEKHFGATRIADPDDRDLPPWKWPAR